MNKLMLLALALILMGSSVEAKKCCKKKGDSVDYIIVGLGTAGAVCARYLSDPVNGKYKNSVLVLEAGQNRTDDPEVLAGLNTFNFDEAPFNPKYSITKVCPDENPLLGFFANEQYSTGRMWFGASAHNYMFTDRGSSDVWDDLAAQVGSNQWTYNNLLPFMKFIETFHGTSTQPNDRGFNGPLQVTQTTPLIEPGDFFFVDAASAVLGAPILPDYNVPDGNTLVGVAQSYNTPDFNRRSFAFDFLPRTILSADGKGLNGRKLRVRSGAFVNRVIFKGDKAIGVEYFSDNQKNGHIVYAKKKVILCAGCPFSAVILQRSGIGPKAVLEDPKVNIPVRVDSPMVGSGLKAHYGIIYAMTQPEDPQHQLTTEFLSLADGRNFFAPAGTGDNLRRFQTDWVNGFFELPAGLLSPLSLNPDDPGVANFTWYLRPRSVGTAFIVDDSPFTLPDIRFNLYSDGDLTDPASDLSAAVAAFKMINAVAMATGATMLYPPASHFPPVAPNDDQLAADAGGCISFTPLSLTNHYAGTCNMGTDISNGVISGTDLHVFGTRNLMVADSSIYPFPATGNTSWQCYIAGIKAANILGFQLP